MSENRFESFIGLVTALSKEIRRIKAAEAEKLGLKGSDVMCLYYLSTREGGLTSSELAREMDVTRAAVSRTISQLEEEGLVEVGDAGHEATRYRAPVRLTELGRERTSTFQRIIARILDEAGGALSDEERASMYSSLSRVLSVLREMD